MLLHNEGLFLGHISTASTQRARETESMNAFTRPRPLGSDTVKLARLRLFMVI